MTDMQGPVGIWQRGSNQVSLKLFHDIDNEQITIFKTNKDNKNGITAQRYNGVTVQRHKRGGTQRNNGRQREYICRTKQYQLLLRIIYLDVFEKNPAAISEFR